MGFADAFSYGSAADVFDELARVVQPGAPAATCAASPTHGCARDRCSGRLRPAARRRNPIRWVDGGGVPVFHAAAAAAPGFRPPAVRSRGPRRTARRRAPARAHHRPGRPPVAHDDQDRQGGQAQPARPRTRSSSCTPTTPNALGVADGDLVEVVSRRGRAVLPRPRDRTPPGMCFAPFHWNDLYGEYRVDQLGDERRGRPGLPAAGVQGLRGVTDPGGDPGGDGARRVDARRAPASLPRRDGRCTRPPGGAPWCPGPAGRGTVRRGGTRLGRRLPGRAVLALERHAVRVGRRGAPPGRRALGLADRDRRTGGRGRDPPTGRRRARRDVESDDGRRARSRPTRCRPARRHQHVRLRRPAGQRRRLLAGAQRTRSAAPGRPALRRAGLRRLQLHPVLRARSQPRRPARRARRSPARRPRRLRARRRRGRHAVDGGGDRPAARRNRWRATPRRTCGERSGLVPRRPLRAGSVARRAGAGPPHRQPAADAARQRQGGPRTDRRHQRIRARLRARRFARRLADELSGPRRGVDRRDRGARRRGGRRRRRRHRRAARRPARPPGDRPDHPEAAALSGRARRRWGVAGARRRHRQRCRRVVLGSPGRRRGRPGARRARPPPSG